MSLTCKVLKHTARADAVRLTARAPPGAPALATHGLNVRCKKTNRAPQRTYRVCVSRVCVTFSRLAYA